MAAAAKEGHHRALSCSAAAARSMGQALARLLRPGRAASTAAAAAAAAPTTPAGNPLPPVVHAVLPASQLPPGGRVIIIGDVHGCHDELAALLAAVGHEPRDTVVFVGDLVGKGPKSHEVLAAVRSWHANGRAFAVRGNWDDATLAARVLLDQGRQPKKPKHAWAAQMLPEDVALLDSLPFSLRLEGYGAVVVHAGLLPGVALEQQQLVHLSKMRDLLRAPDGSWLVLEKPQEGSIPWAPCWSGDHVFFGHDAKRRLQLEHHATGLDTGCVYGGQLTACVLPPLTELQQQQQGAAALSGGEAGRTLEQLGGRIVSVDSHSTYEKPGQQAKAAAPG